MRKVLLYGLLAVGLYGASAVVSARIGTVPERPVYDGLAPPAPYRYVRPPADLADSNEPPLDAKGKLELGPKGSLARSVPTDDGQMLVVFPDEAIAPRKGEGTVLVNIEPLDPARLPPGPPDLPVSGNAYRVDASYERSGTRIATLREAATVVLRYPTHATAVLSLEGRRWRKLDSQAAQASLQLFADTKELGTFAAGGAPPASRAWIAYAAAAAGVLAGVAGYLTGRRRGGRKPRRRRPRTRRPI